MAIIVILCGAPHLYKKDMNNSGIFFNGITWTCEIGNDDGEILDYAIGNTPIEALENALKVKDSDL